MKKSLSGIDISAIVREIPSGYVKRIGYLDKNVFSLKIADRNIIIRLDGWMHSTDGDVELRKIERLRWLENRRVQAVSQRGVERIVIFDMGRVNLVAELFGGGNLVLVSDGIIDFVAKEREFRDRKLKVGEPYVMPSEAVNFFELDSRDFSDILKQGKFDVVRALAVDMGMGGEYAEEVCARAGIDKNLKADAIDDKAAEALYSALLSIRDEITLGKGYIISEETPVSVMPVDSVRYSKKEVFDSFSKAVERYLGIAEKKPDRKDAEMRRAEEELKRVEDTISEVYERYNEIFEELANGRSFELHGFTFQPERAIEQSMQELYAQRKAMQEKIEGLGRARVIEKRAEVKREKRVREEWFERYWWFFTGEDFLVIAGKSADDNERIVHRHLDENDIYVHADIHGGASGVIKTYGREPAESSLSEACRFVACFSKAWGWIGSCDAYWVRADQVTKKPPSGQFLTKGSFMIYGKKNYYRSLPMELAIGAVDMGNEKKPMCAPESVIAKRCSRYAIIVPGKRSVEGVARDLSAFLSLDEGRIARVLPTRGIEIKEMR
jgi:predicted ribosome quality control (RQC) complex YloA/Tae2 family protein